MFITDPPRPPPTELERLRAFAAIIRGMYDNGGHITREQVREALDRIDSH